MTYSEKLRNPKWQRKRLEILQRDDFTCCLCGDKETELHVHHLKYTGEPHEAPSDNLETLCKHCHLLKTFGSKNNMIPFIRAEKINGALIASTETAAIGFFSIMNEDIELIASFKKDSAVFHVISKMFYENLSINNE